MQTQTSPNFKRLTEMFAAMIAEKLQEKLGEKNPKKAPPPPPAHRKHFDMRCRVKNCKTTSRGPRFRFMCQRHGENLSKKQQLAAIAAYNAN